MCILSFQVFLVTFRVSFQPALAGTRIGILRDFLPRVMHVMEVTCMPLGHLDLMMSSLDWVGFCS
jgi:hypothetical protein